MHLQKINSQMFVNNNQKQKTNTQPTFNAALRIYDSTNLLTNKQKDLLWEKAQKVNCDWLYAWLEGSDIPIDVQVLKGEYRSHVETMPMQNGKESYELNPFDAMSRWIDTLLEKYK